MNLDITPVRLIFLSKANTHLTVPYSKTQPYSKFFSHPDLTQKRTMNLDITPVRLIFFSKANTHLTVPYSKTQPYSKSWPYS